MDNKDIIIEKLPDSEDYQSSNQKSFRLNM